MYMKLGFLDSALKREVLVFFEDSVTVSSLLSGCGGDVRVGGLVHCWGVKIGVEECNCDDDVEFLVKYWCFGGECGGGGGNCHCFRWKETARVFVAFF
ncbi:hypothetical protein Tco_0807060 [Tanacetum coccineum]